MTGIDNGRMKDSGIRKGFIILKANGKQLRTIMDGQAVCNNKLHKIRLDGLQPGQKYYYR